MTRRGPGFLESETPNVPPEKARFEVIPAPYERSVSYGSGTAGGPRAILDASQQLELFDGRGAPGRAGIHTGAPVDGRGRAATVLKRIAARAAAAFRAGRVPVLLGGEHTVTLGAVRALHAAGTRFGVVQVDAHADLRDRYEGDPLSHACVMRRIVEETGAPVFQVGVRALCEEEAAYRLAKRIPHLDAEPLALDGLPRRLLPAGFPRTVYVTFDLDGLDPSVLPATGTPVPGGLTWYDAIRVLRKVADGRTIAGFDVVELAPRRGDAVSDFTAARLVYEIMGLCGGSSGKERTRRRLCCV